MRCSWIAFAFFAAAGSALAADAPPTPTMTFAFEEVFSLTSPQVVGETPAGRRQNVQINGGTFSGPGFSGQVLPGGGDYQLIRPDGAVQIDAEYLLRTDDGVVVHGRHVGTILRPKAGQGGNLVTTQTFDAPSGKYGWLNDSVFVSRISPAGDRDHPGVRIAVWKVN